MHVSHKESRFRGNKSIELITIIIIIITIITLDMTSTKHTVHKHP